MEIPIKYDLIQKIKQADGSWNINDIVKNELLKTGDYPFLGLVIGVGLFAGAEFNDAFFGTLSGYGLVKCGAIAMEALVNRMFKGNLQLKAMQELALLSLKMNREGINTSGVLLVDSEQDGPPQYKVKLNDKNLPQLVQSKYIIVPTYDKIGVSIHQEHVMGTKKYVLSFGTRAREFKPALANV